MTLTVPDILDCYWSVEIAECYSKYFLLTNSKERCNDDQPAAAILDLPDTLSYT